MDKYDRKILTVLQRDASMSNSTLGEQIGLSTSQISRRKARLESEGVIEAYRAIVSPPAIGYHLDAFIRVSLHAHSIRFADEFRQFIISVAAVRLACSITGDADYLLHVRLPDLSALSQFINKILLAHPHVREVRSDVVLDLIKDETALAVITGT